MKKKLRKTLAKILGFLAKKTLKKFHPEIIGITGSAGKTSAKNATLAVLSKDWVVRANYANFNTEIGMPMTILGSWKKPGKTWFWIKVVLISSIRLILPKFFFSYPDILILEYGADRPGDIKKLLEIAKPRLGALTAIGDIPVHVEFYQDIESLAREKARLAETLPAAGGLAINIDDQNTKKLISKTRAKVLTFGFSEKADVRINHFEVKVENAKPIGITFKLEHGKTTIPVRIYNTLGKAQAYAAACAACIGVMHNINLVEIAQSLTNYKPAKSRMQILPGKNNSIIIDDSYNSSPIAAASALETLGLTPAKRKIAVLADMRELGKYSNPAHKRVGEQAAKVCDVLFTIGPKARVIAKSAALSGMSDSKIHEFDDVAQAVSLVERTIKKEDVILVKGSLLMGLGLLIKRIKARQVE